MADQKVAETTPEETPSSSVEAGKEPETMVPTPPEVSGGEEEETPRRDRSAESRIGELIAKNKELEHKVEDYETRRQVPTPPTGGTTPEPAIQRAVESLKKIGFVHQEDLARTVQSMEDKMILGTEHSRLSKVFDGSDGRPKYDSTQVEAYMQSHGIFEPEVAYKAMYEQELIDWHIKEASKSKVDAYTTPPKASSKAEEGAITREKIAEMQKSANWRSWYEEHREEILSLMAQGKL